MQTAYFCIRGTRLKLRIAHTEMKHYSVVYNYISECFTNVLDTFYQMTRANVLEYFGKALGRSRYQLLTFYGRFERLNISIFPQTTAGDRYAPLFYFAFCKRLL